MLINLTPRQRAITLYLLTRKSPTTANQMAKRFGASLRTIRYDLDAVRDILKATGVTVLSKPHAGIWVEGTPEQKEQVAAALQDEQGPLVLSPAEREDRMLLRLLNSDDGVKLDDLAESLGCSRTTILRQLPEVERRLRSYKLRVIRTRGCLLLVGAERSRREALAHFLMQTERVAQVAETLRRSIPQTQELALDDWLRPLGRWTEVARAVNETERSLGKTFTDESYMALIIHLVVALQRIEKGQPLGVPAARLTELKERPEWQTALEMAAELRRLTGIDLPEGDLGFLTFHLVGSRGQPSASLTEADPRVHRLVDRFIRRAEEILEVDLARDKLLRDGLTWHLQGLLTRHQFGIAVSNPLRLDIQQQMERVYRVVAQIGTECRDELRAPMSEDEIGFLTVHLAAALERSGHVHALRVLVVCSSGLGSAQLLAARLKRVFGDVEIVGVVSALESGDADWQGRADLVVSTVVLPPLPVPQVWVSPLLSQTDIDLVRKAMGRAADQQPAGISGEAHPAVNQLLAIIQDYAEIRNPQGLRRALQEHLTAEQPPLTLIEPIIREVGLLGIQVDPVRQAGLAVHLQLALPRFQVGQFVQEPGLERMRKEYRALFRAVERGMELFARWHGVELPTDETIPVMRYIIDPDKGAEE